jgi:hypothetical protein
VSLCRLEKRVQKRFFYVQTDIRQAASWVRLVLANNSSMNDPLSFAISVLLFAFSASDQTRNAKRGFCDRV